MKVKIKGEWIDANDEPIVVSLSEKELSQINGIPREEGDTRPRVYGQFPDQWGSVEDMQQYIKTPIGTCSKCDREFFSIEHYCCLEKNCPIQTKVEL